jgi:copper(I)-binding protein
MKLISTALLFGMCGCASIVPVAHGQPPPTVRVDSAWVRAVPQGQFETWAFATITNPGGADALVELRSPDAASVVLRATNVTDAGRKVRTVLSVPVPAASTLVLTPDTYFIAFMQATHAFNEVQSVTATLKFASGAIVPVTFRIAAAEGDPADAGP